MLQERPICFHCTTTIESNDFVFEAPCGHEQCPSVAFHPICLMEFRDKRPEFFAKIRESLLRMAGEMLRFQPPGEEPDGP